VKVLTTNLDNNTTLKWGTSDGASSYEIVWRETSAPNWEHVKSVGDTTTTSLDISKDNMIFAVRAVDKAGHRSLPVVPEPER